MSLMEGVRYRDPDVRGLYQSAEDFQKNALAVVPSESMSTLAVVYAILSIGFMITAAIRGK